MARIEWVEQRLQLWARWRSQRGAGQSGFARTNILARWWRPPNNREAEAHIPVDEVEAFATDQAVRELDVHLRDTIEQVYLGSGSVGDDAARLGCSVSTVHARISTAHKRLRVSLDTRDPQRTPDTPGFMSG
jgi:DNA-directed RNA polymerase specialized sigma24 family protein